MLNSFLNIQLIIVPHPIHRMAFKRHHTQCNFTVFKTITLTLRVGLLHLLEHGQLLPLRHGGVGGTGAGRGGWYSLQHNIYISNLCYLHKPLKGLKTVLSLENSLFIKGLVWVFDTGLYILVIMPQVERSLVLLPLWFQQFIFIYTLVWYYNSG